MLEVDAATRDAVRRFRARPGDCYDVAALILFGSRARGDHQLDSDADLAVLLNGDPQRVLPLKLDMADLAYDVMLETGVLISPLPIWREQWERPASAPNPSLFKTIAREGVEL